MVGGNDRERTGCVLRSTVDGPVKDGVGQRREQRAVRIWRRMACALRRDLSDDRAGPPPR